VTTEIYNRTGSTLVIITDILPQDGFDMILGQRFLQDNEVELDFNNNEFRFSTHQPKMRKIGRI